MPRKGTGSRASRAKETKLKALEDEGGVGDVEMGNGEVVGSSRDSKAKGKAGKEKEEVREESGGDVEMHEEEEEDEEEEVGHQHGRDE